MAHVQKSVTYFGPAVSFAAEPLISSSYMSFCYNTSRESAQDLFLYQTTSSIVYNFSSLTKMCKMVHLAASMQRVDHPVMEMFLVILGMVSLSNHIWITSLKNTDLHEDSIMTSASHLI